jgi:serine/threonine protein kinase
MDPRIQRSQDLIARFEREADTIANLSHANIVKVYDKGHQEVGDRTRYFIVMEYVQGEDLATFINERRFISFERKLEMVIKICRALDHAHRKQVIHRDIKPSNVRITADGDVCVLDFGLAKFTDTQPLMTEGVFGTPQYMSPEQTLSSRSVDSRGDQFSTALVLYELITYEKPFRVDDPTDSLAYMSAIRSAPHVPILEVLPQCAPELAAIVERALQKRPDDRFPTCADFAEALSGFLKTLPQKEEELARAVEDLRKTVQKCADRCNSLRAESIPATADDWEPPLEYGETVPLQAKDVRLDYGLNLLRYRNLDARKAELLDTIETLGGGKVEQWKSTARTALRHPHARRVAVIGFPAVLAIAAIVGWALFANSQPGKVEIDIKPWAYVDSLVNVETSEDAITSKGEQTPLNLELRPGRYTLHISNPKFGKKDLPVEISPGQTTSVHWTFPGFKP